MCFYQSNFISNFTFRFIDLFWVRWLRIHQQFHCNSLVFDAFWLVERKVCCEHSHSFAVIPADTTTSLSRSSWITECLGNKQSNPLCAIVVQSSEEVLMRNTENMVWCQRTVDALICTILEVFSSWVLLQVC